MIFILGLNVIPALATLQETLPSWHWANGVIDELRLRGGFEEFFTMNRPYYKGEVAAGLVKIKERLDAGELVFSDSDRRLYDKLVLEFRNEINMMDKDTDAGNPLSLGLRLQADLDKPDAGKARYRGVYRSKVSASLGRHVTVYNGMNFDQYLVDDSSYVGKKWEGIAGYTEQAYAAAELGRFRFKLGRDFLRWGPGESGSLLFSDVAQPMDQLNFSFHTGPFLFSFIAASLDDKALDPDQADRLGGSLAQRWLSAHRVDARFWQGRLELALTEAVVYGGVDRQFSWVYSNPFLSTHLAQLNAGGRVNSLLSMDVRIYPFQRWQVSGSFLIDQEVHIKKNESKDLEPNQFAWLLGSRWGDPFGFQGMTLSAEYVQVRNRTYKTVHTYETFSYRNTTLGHPLGNDFDHWQFELSQWFAGLLRINVGYGMTQAGEGGVFTPWDEPWKEIPVDEGYTEPFPTGVVEEIQQWHLKMLFLPSVHWGVEVLYQGRQRENTDHILDSSRDENMWRIGVWFDGDLFFKL